MEPIPQESRTASSGKHLGVARMRPSADVAPFDDYSEAEWHTIVSAIRAVRKAPISEEERDALRQAAHKYRHDIAERKSGRHATGKQRAKSFADAAKNGGK